MNKISEIIESTKGIWSNKMNFMSSILSNKIKFLSSILSNKINFVIINIPNKTKFWLKKTNISNINFINKIRKKWYYLVKLIELLLSKKSYDLNQFRLLDFI